MDEAGLVVREYGPEDEACIYSTWRNGSFYGQQKKQHTSSDRYFREKTQEIKAILSDPATRVRVAVLEQSPQTILGYSVTNGTHLEWIFVKVDFRRQGIARLLCPKHIETYTDKLTKIGKTIAEMKKLKLKENH
jgi:ribosomal protein S18 acetylase RimI-like enzyme